MKLSRREVLEAGLAGIGELTSVGFLPHQRSGDALIAWGTSPRSRRREPVVSPATPQGDDKTSPAAEPPGKTEQPESAPQGRKEEPGQTAPRLSTEEPRPSSERQPLKVEGDFAGEAAPDAAKEETQSQQAREKPLDENKRDSFRKRILELLEESTVPAVSLAYIEKAKVSWAEAFGIADKEQGVSATSETIFQAASLTKPTFAYVVLRLAEENKFDIDEPLRSYLPSIKVSEDPTAERITARMVLDHTSGLPLRHSTDWPMPLDFVPTTKFSYSGAGYLYLQQVIEHVTKKPLNDLMKEQLVRDPRFGIENSSFVWVPEYGTKIPFAIGYDWDGAPVELVSHPKEASSAASLHTTAAQYARFMIGAMMNKDSTPHPKSLLPHSVAESMLEIHYPLADYLFWGLGWGLQTIIPERYKVVNYWHHGDSRGYTSFAMASVETQSGLVLMTNSRHGMRLCGEISHLFFGQDEPIFNWIYGTFYKGKLRPWRGHSS